MHKRVTRFAPNNPAPSVSHASFNATFNLAQSHSYSLI